jgi:hypothetical protein
LFKGSYDSTSSLRRYTPKLTSLYRRFTAIRRA